MRRRTSPVPPRVKVLLPLPRRVIRRSLLSILPAGQLPPNPAELLSLPSIKELFPQMQQDFDLVLIDP